MIGCDYNGWTDLPEEEREALDAYSDTTAPYSDTTAPPRSERARRPSFARLTPRQLRRRAA